MNLKKTFTKIASAVTLMAVVGCSSLQNKIYDSPRKLTEIKGDVNNDGKNEIVLCLGDYYHHVPGKSRVSLHNFTENWEDEMDMQCFAYVTNNFPIDQTKVELRLEDKFRNDGYPDLIMTIKNNFSGEENTYSYINDKGNFFRLGGESYQD